ncbi:Ig-like domain-containing protein [Cellulomonas oligotrophica]|uniref:Putative repeat protein (TIGR01451 family) n=1 Tax=Cellulomonas oligotrophica TaxID=931536 RepID=A0A7Y9FEG3_9CELL|nr:Ig-like domain-containing protein [Cellulomonas oligotrophica]NYD85838.1 putative repeat protein (TIGR01451 family) [Cellulomonas oligotrophica]GIG31155.1 hypothetical protein Col01nite_03140 [Cellulomonas oligotrophica]
MSARPHTRRGSRALLAALAAAVVLLTQLVAAAPARADVDDAFVPVYSTNEHGAIVMTGNTLMTCSSRVRSCPAVQQDTGGSADNSDFSSSSSGAYVDVLADGATTFSSSSASLHIADSSTVRFAALVWGGRTSQTSTTGSNPDLRHRAWLAVDSESGADLPGRTVTADHFAQTSRTEGYQGYLDVTDVVTAAGSGTYTVGNVQSTRNDIGRFAGWSLVVVVADEYQPMRNLTVFRGFAEVEAAASSDVQFTVDGFRTPLNGEVRSTLGAVTYEGDRGISGDSFSVDGHALTDVLGDPDNVFNSTISERGYMVDQGRDPLYFNQLGLDIDTFDADGVLANGATSATLRATTTQDQYWVGMVTFQTELYEPSVSLVKWASWDPEADADGVVGPGDTVEYGMVFLNEGLDTAVDPVLRDAVPTGTTYVPGSMSLDGVPLTDEDDRGAPDGDGGRYRSAGGGDLEVHVGDMPGTDGEGDLEFRRFTFSVVVDDDVALDQDLVNVAQLSYTGAVSGTVGGSVSNTALLRVGDEDGYPEEGQETVAPTLVDHLVVLTPAPGRPGADVAVLDGASAAGGGALTVVGVTAPAHGTATVVGDTVRYVPDPDFSGRDAFTYTVSDADGNVTSAVVRVDVLNDAPVAVDDALDLDTDVPVGAATAVDVLANDTDPNGEVLAVRGVAVGNDVVMSGSLATPAGGTVTVTDGQVTYTKPPGGLPAGATDTFGYLVVDQRGRTSEALVTVTSVDLNQDPVAHPDTATVPAGGAPVTVDVVADDTDGDGDTLAVTGVGSPVDAGGTVRGSAAVTPEGRVRYTPPTGWDGLVTLPYTISDGRGGTAGGVVEVTVTNTAPTAGDDAATTAHATAVDVPVLTDDTDANGDTLTVVGVDRRAATGAVAVATVGGVQVVRYTPATGFVGTEQVGYTVADGRGSTATATVTVTVTNAPPVARDDAASTRAGVPVAGVPVLANDSDPNVAAGSGGQALSVLDATADQGATVTVAPDGTLTVAPADGFVGTVQVTYRLTDGVAVVDGTLRVEVLNNGPVTVADLLTTPTSSTDVPLDVLANDVDPEGDPLTLVWVTDLVDAQGAARGTARVDGGVVLVTPAAGWAGTATFTYLAGDGTDTAAGTATVVVLNDVPVVPDAVASTPTDAPVTVPVLDAVQDANVAAGHQTLQVVQATADEGATVLVDDDGRLVVTPAPGFVGEVRVDLEVSDGQDAVPGVLRVTVLNADPQVADLSRSTGPADALDVDVLASVVDPNVAAGHQQLSVVAASADHADVTVQPDGRLRVTPHAGYAGPVAVQFDVSDGVATVPGTLTVTVANAGPVAVDDVATAGPAERVELDVLANDTDANADDLSISSVDVDAALGTAEVTTDAGGRPVVAFTPAAGVVGLVELRYVVDDGQGGSAAATVVVDVANAPPQTVDDVATTSVGRPVAVDVLADDSDANADAGFGDQVLAVVSADVDHPGATAVVTADGWVEVTPPPGWVGDLVVTYEVSDGTDTVTGTLHVTVTNTVPVASDDAFDVVAGGAPRTLPVTDDDVDHDGDDLAVTAVTPAVEGVAGVVNGELVYTPPAAGWTGQETLTYTVADGRGGTATATVVVTVVAGLVAGDDTATTPSGTAVDVDVLADDAAPVGGALEITDALLQGASGATVQVVGPVGAQRVRYTPAPGFVGTDEVAYTVVDRTHGGSGTATLRVQVANAPPVAVPDTATTTRGASTGPVDVLDDDWDANVVAGVGGQVLAVLSAAADHGAAEVDPDGAVVVQPAAGYLGDVVVTYRLSDGVDVVDGTLVVSVVNTAVAAAEDLRTTATSTTVTIDVTRNDVDDDGDPVQLVPGSVTAPVDPDGTPRGDAQDVRGNVRYAPPPGWTGVVTFDYAVTDGVDVTTGQVTVAVENAEPDLSAVATSASAAPGQTVTVPVRADVVDENAAHGYQVLTVADATSDGADVHVDADGALVVTPRTGRSGTLTVAYVVSDGVVDVPGTLELTVLNVAPRLDDAAVTADPVRGVDVPVLDGAADDNGDDLALTAGAPAHGSARVVTVRGTPVVRYRSTPGFLGVDQLTCTVDDGHGATATATLTVTVPNTPPVAAADAVTVRPGADATGVDVLANDSDANVVAGYGDQVLAVTSATADAGARVHVRPDGSLDVAPTTGFVGVVTVTYVLSDGVADVDGTLRVTVLGASGDAPTGGAPTGGVPGPAAGSVVGGAAAAAGAVAGALARTGLDPWRVLGGAVGVVLLGVVLAVTARRRRG